MKRVAHKAKDFKAASEWDIQQHVAMSAQERLRAAQALKRRAYGANAKDVRECHRQK